MNNLHDTQLCENPVVYHGRLQVDISRLKKQDPAYGKHIYILDIATLLPFAASDSGHLGRAVQRFVCEVLDDYLHPDKEMYVNTGSGQYLLYLKAPTRALGELKCDVARKEIRRRAELYIAEKSRNTREPSDSASRLPKTSPPADEIIKKKRANMAMKKMVEAREKSGLFMLNYSDLADRTQILFQPVCNVPKKYLTGFLACSASCQTNMDPADELGLLVRATQELERAFACGTRVVIIVPVSLETLRRHPFNCYYMGFCRTIPADLRKLIVLQIKNIPDACPLETLREVVRWASSLVRSVIIEINAHQHFPPYSVASSAHACSISLDRVSYDQTKNIRFIGSVARKSRSVGCMVMAQGVHSQMLLLAALKAGYAYISGPAIQPDQDSLHPIRPFIPESISDEKGCH